jgi:site-specific recombinase XerD
MTGDLERSYAQSNRQLLEAFSTYLISLNRSTHTRRAYLDAVGRFIEVLGSKDAAEADRGDIRRFQTTLLSKGVTANSVRLHIGGIRAFFNFLRLAGVTRIDPTLLLAQRKLPSRVPRVLTVEEIERLIAASETPLEAAVIETLYATGMRVSELSKLRIENVDFANRVIRVLKSKRDQDRIVLFGRKAAAAIEKYLNGRTTGFLFEAPARIGYVVSNRFSWLGRFYVDSVQQCVTLGRIDSMSWSEAQQRLRDILAETPGYHPHPARPYDARSVRLLLSRVAFRAKVRGVHPHAFRRAFATHMLEDDANLRAIQDLLGHKSLSTTMIYTNLSASNLKRVYDRCHPHAKRRPNVEKEQRD